MRIRPKEFFLFLAALLITACSVDVSAPTAPSRATLPAPEVQTGRETPAYPSPGVTSTSRPLSSSNSQVPVVWADLKLSGKLVFVRTTQNSNEAVLSVQELDLATGDLSTLFQAPSLSWIYTMSVSPDAKTLVMAYNPPGLNNAPSYTSLYQMPLDASQPPARLFPSPLPEDSHYPTFQVYRIPSAGGSLELLADKAFWPRLSRDGKQLVYIASSPQDGKNKIWLADPDGKNAREMPLSAGAPDVIDAPVFSADGQSLLFSSPGPAQPVKRFWLDQLLGVTLVEAHNVPSEWWRVPLAGGTPVQLTHLQAPGLFASLSPDGRFFACYTANSLFVMNPDGSGLRLLLDNLGGTYGSVSWVP